MIRLTIKNHEGLAEYDRVLGLAADQISRLNPVWDNVVHPWLLEHLKRQFKTEGERGGAPWADYSGEPKYRAYKKSALGNLRILRWMGGSERLFPSLTQRNAPWHIWESWSSGFRFGSSLPYAARLEKGGTGPFGEKYPGRIMLRMTRHQKREMTRAITRAVKDADGSGLRGARRQFFARTGL